MRAGSLLPCFQPAQTCSRCQQTIANLSQDHGRSGRDTALEPYDHVKHCFQEHITSKRANSTLDNLFHLLSLPTKDVPLQQPQ